jgi:hypothetical protein
MVNIALIGFAIALAANIPFILYVVWSWQLIRGHSDDLPGQRNWLRRSEASLRLVLWAVVVSIVWPLWASGMGMLTIFLTYDRQGEELAFAQFLGKLCLLPITISQLIGEFWPGTYVDPRACYELYVRHNAQFTRG